MQPNQGFTLLEMLVVLVITALISTLLLQGFMLVLDLYQRFSGNLQQVQYGAMQEAWFRDSIVALIPDYEDIPDGHLFVGRAREFSGLTLSSLEADNGVPMPFGWQLATNTQQGQSLTALQYQYSTGKTVTVKQWTGETGEFEYLDAVGEWHTTWPPSTFGELPPQLPQAIVLTVPHPRYPLSWIINISARKSPDIDIRVEDLDEFL